MPPMRILILQHDDDSGLGSLEAPLRAAGAEVEVWQSHRKAAPNHGVVHYDGVIVLGGIVNPDQDDEHAWLATERFTLERAIEAGIPALGVCLGGQLLAQTSGGTAGPAPRPEIGWHEIEATPALADDELFSVLPERFHSFEWHYYCFQPPARAELLARNERFNQAFRIGERAWGTQFHIEAMGGQIREWLEMAADDVRAAGLDPEAIAAETDARDAEHRAIAARLGERFAAIVNRYAVARKA
jgi:GMP synthase-like glutamine amidotransferase